MSEATATWLTQKAYDRLVEELEYLKGPARSEIANKIAEARDEGDLKENGGYHACREEQGKQEARIRQLEHLLKNATVGEQPADDGVVEQGMVITATIAGREKRFLLASRESAAGTDMDVFSETSPLGEAIVGHKEGDEVTYEAPNGATIAVKLLKVEVFES